MERRTRTLLEIVIIVLCVSILLTYLRAIVMKDFNIILGEEPVGEQTEIQ